MNEEHLCPAGGERGLTPGEIALVRSVFGAAIDCEKVRICRRRWMPFQPKRVTMAPMGNLHFHPHAEGYCDDFAAARLSRQAHFIHEMTHVWQTQTKGRWYLPLHRPFSRRYDYSLVPGWKLADYGIEQQAEIVAHAFLLRRGVKLPGVEGRRAYELLVDFPGAEGGA